MRAGVQRGRVLGPRQLQRGGERGRAGAGGREGAERGDGRGRGVRRVVPRGSVRSMRRVEFRGEEGNNGRVDEAVRDDARGRGVGGAVDVGGSPRGGGRGVESERVYGDPRESERKRRGERSAEGDGEQETEPAGERGSGRGPSGGRKPQAGTWTRIHFLSVFVSFHALLQHTIPIETLLKLSLCMIIWRELNITIGRYATYAENDRDNCDDAIIVIVAACALITIQNKDVAVPI